MKHRQRKEPAASPEYFRQDTAGSFNNTDIVDSDCPLCYDEGEGELADI